MTALPLPELIETERMMLRPWKAGDDAALLGALEESVDHLLPWIPWASADMATPERCRALIDGWIAQREAGANFIWAAFERETRGRLLGGIGLYARVGAGRLEVGYWLRRAASGRGLATEAVAAVAEAAFARPSVTALEIRMDPGNAASRRVPEKLGYRCVGVSPRTDAEGRTVGETLTFVLERGVGREEAAPEGARPPVGDDGLVFEAVDPTGPEAAWCLDRYYAELRERFEEGFDAAMSTVADPAALAPPRGLFLVGSIRGKPVACGAFRITSPGVAYLKRMWVDGSLRGLGLGRRTLQALEDAAVEMGCDVAELETNRALGEAIRLYRTSGYEEVPPFNDEFYAHHWFRKRIHAAHRHDGSP